MTTQPQPQPQPEAMRLANQLRDILPAFRTPSHERGVLNGAIQRLEQLHAECEALRATQSDTLLRLLCDLRFALGDNGARMQHDLVEYARGLRADAERYRWLRENRHVLLLTGFFGNGCVNREIDEVDAAIDAARAAKEQSNG